MAINTVVTINSTPALSTEGGGRNMAIARDGKLWVIYSRKPTGVNYQQIFAAFSSDGGQTWTEEQVTAVNNKHHFFPAMAIDAFDNLHIVYTSTGRTPFTTRWGVFYRERTIGGWQPEETVALLDVTNPGQDYPAIAVGVAGVPHVVWAGLGWGTHLAVKNIQYRAKIGGTWGTVEQVTDMAAAQDMPSLAIDSFGAVHVSWSGKGWGINPTVSQVAYGHGPAAWITGNITDRPNSSFYGRVAVDSDDDPHVVFYDSAAPAIYYAKRAGVIWNSPEQVSHEGGNPQGYPSIALDRSNNVQVVWSAYGSGLSNDFMNIWYRKKAGAWLGFKNLTDSEVNDQWAASLLWARYPEVGGVKTNVLPGLQKMVWEDMGASILFAETPAYSAGKTQAHIVS
jgi:hypothetical protein